MFTTSARGSGDELRLAHCPPRAGPGLSHGGQMTAEAKRVRSCSPQELLEAPPYPRRWAALPKQSSTPRQTGWGRWWWILRFRPQPAPPLTRGQQGRWPPPSLPSQAQSSEHPSRSSACPLGHPGSGQRPPRMPSTPKHISEINGMLQKWSCWRICYFFLDLSLLHCEMRGGGSMSPRGTSQLTSALACSTCS